MKKMLIVAALAGLTALAACGGSTGNVAQNAAESNESALANAEAEAPMIGENELLAAEARAENTSVATENAH